MDQLTKLPDGDPDGTRTFATVLVLAASGMMFAALVLLYLLLRADAPTWPPPESAPLPSTLASIATGAIALSSITMWMGTRSLRRAKLRALPSWIGATFLLGLVFFVLVGALWVDLLAEGFSSQNPHGGMFYLMTAFHGLHLLTGLALLSWIFRGARRGRYHGRQAIAVRMVGRVWHFLGLGWGAIFVSLFLLG